jgi:L-asparagine transporter-like permease
MKLVDNVSEWRRWWSMRWIIATAFLAAIPAAYGLLPNDWLPSIPQWIKSSLALATLFSAGAAGVARVMKQKPTTDETDEAGA